MSWLRTIAYSTVLMTSAAQAQLYVPPHEVIQDIPIIGVLPMQLSDQIENHAMIAASIDAEVAAALTKAGFKVHDAKEYRAIEEDYQRLTGGWFDPLTGKVKPPVRQAVIGRTIAKFLERYELEGFVSVHLIDRSVEFKDTTEVSWDGVIEDIVVKDSVPSKLKGAFDGPRQGRISALSLQLEIFDHRGRPVYDAAGGIAALTRVVNKKAVEVDISEVLNDSSRLQRAIEITVWPLAHQEKADSVKQFSAAGKVVPGSEAQLASRTLPATPPFSAAQIKERVKTIALKAVNASWHPDATAVDQNYESLLSASLTKAGYRVVPASAYATAAGEAALEVGGIYDPVTGAVIAEKSKALNQAIQRRLQQQHGVDAVLIPNVEYVSASYDDTGDAKWDGVTQSVFKTKAGWNGQPTEGMQTALSLNVRLEDLTGEPIYTGRSGIELTALFISGYFDRIPKEELLKNETTSRRAVDLALAGMLPR